MSKRNRKSNRTNNPVEAQLIRDCISTLLATERVVGTRALALAIQEIEDVDSDTTGYAERRWAALPEEREFFTRTIRRFQKETGRAADFERPVIADPLPPSAKLGER